MNKFWKSRKQLLVWLIAILSLLTGNIAATEIKDYVDFLGGRKSEGSFIWLLGYVGAFLFAVILIYRHRKTLFYPQTRSLTTEKNPPKKENLVLFLSDLPDNSSSSRSGVPQGIELTGNLDLDLQSLVIHKTKDPKDRSDPPIKWQWEMPLRGIRHHLGRLRTITIICSEKSLKQAHWFGHILRKTYGSLLKVSDSGWSGLIWYEKLWRSLRQLFQKADPPTLIDIPVRVWIKQGERSVLLACPTEELEKGGWDFENFDDLSQALIQLLLELKKEDPEENEIMIDFTGGNKVTSVVAAAVTFNRPIKAQYVQTNPEWEVRGYDIELKSSLTEGVGAIG